MAEGSGGAGAGVGAAAVGEVEECCVLAAVSVSSDFAHGESVIVLCSGRSECGFFASGN